MARTAQRDNVSAIRPGIAIPAQQPDADAECITIARLAKSYDDQAYQLAKTEPNSEKHRLALHMAGLSTNLPCNNLRLLVTPVTPKAEWFYEASLRVRTARAVLALIESQCAHAFHLDSYDRGERAQRILREIDEKREALDLAILDALRTPATKKGDVLRKQEMIGKREWAEKHRPAWQAIVDEELARFPTKARRPRAGGSR